LFNHFVEGSRVYSPVQHLDFLFGNPACFQELFFDLLGVDDDAIGEFVIDDAVYAGVFKWSDDAEPEDVPDATYPADNACDGIVFSF